jgi:hypothetical protein
MKLFIHRRTPLAGALAVLLAVSAPACQAPPPVYGWQPLQPLISPPALAFSAVAYNSHQHRAVLFGGISSGEWRSDTWEWDGRTWQERIPHDHPPAREKSALAYDTQRDRMVLFGGADGLTLFGDTWEWDGDNWLAMRPTHQPPPRCCHAMAYDSGLQAVLLYGGWDNQTNTFFNDTWLWNGQDWLEVTDPAAPQASGHALVTFPPGGSVLAGQLFFGTLEWNGAAWTQIPFAVSNPGSRSGAGLVYDSQFQRVLLFGGSRDSVPLTDTWSYDGVGWTELKVTPQPPERYGHIVFYDDELNAMVLFGGVSAAEVFPDTWALRLPEDLVPYAAPEP